MLAAEFEKEFEGWGEKLKCDEWYFCNLRESMVDRISPEVAFNEIDEVVNLIIKTNEEFLCTESFELLLSLARKSETTEPPELLSKKWGDLGEHMSSFSEYQIRKFGELSKWYRKNAL